MFNIDFDILINWITITFLRKGKFIAFLMSCVDPIITLNDNLKEFRNKIIYRLHHNGQVCYLEAVMNDHFDDSERRVYIEDGQVNTGTFIYTLGEDQPLFLPSFIYSYQGWFLNGE